MRTSQVDHPRFQRHSAAVMRRCAASLNAMASATRTNKSQPSRWMAGSRSSVAYKALAFVCDMQRGEGTTAFPFIDELTVEAMRVLAEERSTQWLIRRFHELRDREPFEDAREEITSRTRDRAAYREALKAEANTQREIAAIDEILEQRGIDPRNFRGDGYLEIH